MRIAELFHGVKVATVTDKQAFWKLCKTAASQDKGGVAVGLTKIAYDIWADSYERGARLTASQRDREAFASSFGSAYAAEGMATKLAEAGHISSNERDYLHSVIAESAVRDLEEMTKSADVQEGLEYGGEPPMNADQSPPPAPEGEAIGAEPDPMAGQTEGLDKAHKVVDNMIFLAQQVQLPQLAQELDQMRDQIAQHFADGHAYLPSELQHHFAQSEHAEAFMKKYKQRFGSPAVSGAKKTAGSIRDWLEHKGIIGNKASPFRHGPANEPDSKVQLDYTTGSIHFPDGRVERNALPTQAQLEAVVEKMLLERAQAAPKTAEAQDDWLSWRTRR